MKSIHCPSCDKILVMDDDQVGDVIECPRCKGHVDTESLIEPEIPRATLRHQQDLVHSRYCGTCGEKLGPAELICHRCKTPTGSTLPGQKPIAPKAFTNKYEQPILPGLFIWVGGVVAVLSGIVLVLSFVTTDIQGSFGYAIAGITTGIYHMAIGYYLRFVAIKLDRIDSRLP